MIQKTFDFSGDGCGPCNAPVSENVKSLFSKSDTSPVRNLAKLLPGRSAGGSISDSSRMVGSISIQDINEFELLFSLIFFPIK